MVIWALHLPEDVNGGFEASVAGLINYLNLDISKPVSSLRSITYGLVRVAMWLWG